MDQTPVHDQHNPDLLRLIPVTAKRLIEVGCSSGALAREYKKISPDCDYFGIEIDPDYTQLARRYCDDCTTLDIEAASEDFWSDHAARDCWIFGDTLEHLKDPWRVLRRIRETIPAHGAVVACIPNVQHWSMQVRLSVGDFRYQSSGLLDRTHLRWFSRQTMIEMFNETGYAIEAGIPRIFNEPQRDSFLPLIEEMARRAGVDPQIAIQDALPLQYVLRATPKHI